MPADELSSWLGDDACAKCGSQVRAGHLYCSRQCREEDAKASTSPAIVHTLATSPNAIGPGSASGHDHSTGHHPGEAAFTTRHTNEPALTSAPVQPAAMPTAIGGSKPHSRSLYPGDAQSTNSRFRYASPSLNLLAKYSAALTSPALAAHDRTATHSVASFKYCLGSHGNIGTLTGDKEWTARSECSPDGQEGHGNANTNRRRSWRSTLSSASDALSTDSSIPSPALRSQLGDNDNLDDLEPTNLNFAPSVTPAASILLNTNSQRENIVHRSSPPPEMAGSGDSKAEMPHATMTYARRPSRTNLSGPVLFTSPVLATTVMKKVPANRRSRSAARRSVGSNNAPEGSSKQTSPASAAAASHANAIPVHRQRPIAMRKSQSAPPQVASASSSAGKTLRASSPLNHFGHESCRAGAGANPVCGRYGCYGLSSSSESESIAAPSDFPTRSRHDRWNGFVRPSTLLGHKHTHSAGAGLNLLAKSSGPRTEGPADATAASMPLPPLAAKTGIANTLVMTPAMTVEPVASSRQGAIPKVHPLNTAPVKAVADAKHSADQAERDVRSPPRGRSKARGRSSSSRRSPSPPRGIARRGRSSEAEQAAAVQGNEKRMLSPSSVSSLRSGPITMSRTSPQTSISRNDSEGDDETDDDRRNGRRGRSPTERGRREAPATVTKSTKGPGEDTIKPMVSGQFIPCWTEGLRSGWIGFTPDISHHDHTLRTKQYDNLPQRGGRFHHSVDRADKKWTLL